MSFERGLIVEKGGACLEHDSVWGHLNGAKLGKQSNIGES